MFYLKASPKAISRRTSYLRVRLEFLRYPQFIRCLFNDNQFGPPLNFTLASSWPWIGHPVSGLLYMTYSPFSDSISLRLHSFLEFNLATYNNSLDRSTKSTISRLKSLYLLVNIGFQVLFHSPPGVLFTFPSRYCSSIGHQVVFRLGGWSPRLPTGFLVSRGTLDPAIQKFSFKYVALTLSGRPSHAVLLENFLHVAVRNPGDIATSGLAWSAFARHYSRNLGWCLFLALLRCFSSGGSLPIPIWFSTGYLAVGFPIRKSPDHSSFAAPRSLSQLITSFIGSWCQGIPLALFLAWPSRKIHYWFL